MIHAKHSAFAFLFPGQGAYYPLALQQAERTFAACRTVREEIDEAAYSLLGRGLIESCGTAGAKALAVSDPMALQLALYACACMSATALEARGIRPWLSIGHSFGEIAALAHAGAFSWGQGARIVCDRTEALAAFAPTGGAMLAVSLSPQRAAAALGALHGFEGAHELAIAVENHDAQTVISGERTQLEMFARHVGESGVSSVFLASPHGFHHPKLADAEREFSRRLERYEFHPLRHEVWSPILGRAYNAQDDIRLWLARHLVAPVRFSATARAAYRAGVRIFVECGASDALGRIIKRALPPAQSERTRVYSLFPNAIAGDSAAKTLSQLLEELNSMNMMSPNTAFEKFWRERSPHLLMHIKTEFEYFLASQHLYGDDQVPAAEAQEYIAAAAPATMQQQQNAPPAATTAAAPAPSAPQSSPRPAPESASQLSRAQLFQKLAGVYAEAMEYPVEVFTESVELEAELGIDSVKQTEIMGRVSQMFNLRPLPPDVRLGDYLTLGQIVDLVHGSKPELSTV